MRIAIDIFLVRPRVFQNPDCAKGIVRLSVVQKKGEKEKTRKLIKPFTISKEIDCCCHVCSWKSADSDVR